MTSNMPGKKRSGEGPNHKASNVLLPDPRPREGLLGPADSVWVLDFVQERFHNTSPGDYEDAFTEAGAVEQGRA